jgi:hypothetical protein
MEHACFLVIDPNDRMEMMAAHGMSPFVDPVPAPSTLGNFTPHLQIRTFMLLSSFGLCHRTEAAAFG